MKQARLQLLFLVTTCFIMSRLFSQVSSTGNLPAADNFVGSTPCDSLIRSLLQIPLNEKCDFIKWNVSLAKNNSDTFQLTALYGESQPNTNGFIGGGKKIAVNGKYVINYGAKSNPKGRVYYLNNAVLQSSLLLIEMDRKYSSLCRW